MATSAGRIFRGFSKAKTFRIHGCSFVNVQSRSSQCTRKFNSAAPLAATINLDMPSLSPTMEKGNIVKWHKKEGDAISPGDVLCDIETDKAVVSMDTEEEGILAKIIAPENSKDITVGALIALMVEEGDDWKNVEVPAGAGAPQAESSSTSDSKPAQATPASAQPQAAQDHGQVEHGHLIGPSVRKLLQEYNLSASDVQATGPAGALLKSDVQSFIQTKNLKKVEQTAPAPVAVSGSPQPPSPAPAISSSSSVDGPQFEDIPLNNMRRTIAKRLTESKSTIPHAYLSIDSNVGAVTGLRKRLMAEGVKVSINDFIIKACALALQRNPQVNAVWTGEGSQLSSSVDISVAVATPNGLITPIVRSASYLSVDQIGATVKELAGRAKEGKLKPQEFQGGSFSISNLGMFGISEFTAVINPPQLAIMAVGTSRAVASAEGNQSKMTVTLSFDSRAINDVEATRFLEDFRSAMENPQTMLAGTQLDAEAEAFVF